MSKAKETEMANDDRELSQEELEQAIEELDIFEDSFFSHLAGTSMYEVIPTVDDNGKPLTSKQLSLIKREIGRLGYKVLYRIDCGGEAMVINPRTLQVAIMSEEIH